MYDPGAIDPVDRLQAVLADRYTIERRIGSGGMVDVFLTHDRRHDRKVAIKVMHRDLAEFVGVERVLREIETTARLQHPHILPLFDSGSVDGTVFYVMPYVEGESLRGRLKGEGQLPLADALRIPREIASALGYAHRHGVVRRDIKHDNVLFQDGQALLTDFGIALPKRDEERARLTGSGMTLGTPRYMSPEQVAGQEIDARSDIHGLAVLVYEMLAGQPPFIGPTATAILGKVMAENARPITEHRRTVPPHVTDAIARALQKLPADRWQTTSEFVDALNDRVRPWGPAPPRAAAGSRHGCSPRCSRSCSDGPVCARRFHLRVRGPVRFGVEFEEGMVPSFTPVVRISADGGQLFVSAMVDRREEVVRRTLDRLGMAVIEGAGQGEQGTGNSRPFVSPDGRWWPTHDRRSCGRFRPKAEPRSSLPPRTGPAAAGAATAGSSTRRPTTPACGLSAKAAATLACSPCQSGQGVDVFIQSFPDPKQKRR